MDKNEVNKESIDYLEDARRVFQVEIDALTKMKNSLGDSFLNILNIVRKCQGKVIITGMGKPGHIAKKIAATFSSLGTSSFYLHPGEAMHGDLGMIDSTDVVIAISYSGESDEIVNILPSIKMIGAKLLAITGNGDSTLAKASNVVQLLPPFEEACHLGLAPTSSTTVELVYGDALAVTASYSYGFRDVDFGKYHPAGALGKKLVIKVSDIMSQNEKNAVISINSSLKDAIIELSKKGLGVVTLINEYGSICGIITDGDLRRQLEKGVNVYTLDAVEIMTKHPVCISPNCMAIEALSIMKKKNISCLPVVDNTIAIGTIRLQDIIGIGIVG